MAAHENDAEVRRLLEARDLDGLWPLVGRPMHSTLKRALRAFVKQELARATLAHLAELFELGVPGQAWQGARPGAGIGGA